MLEILIRKSRYQIFDTVKYRILVVSTKLCSSDALVRSKPKLKDLVETDRVRKKRKFEKYFIENLFLNKFQVNILRYPEITSLKEFQSLKEHCELTRKYLNDRTNYGERDFEKSDEVISTLKNLELTGFKLPKSQSGFGYLESEYNYTQETIGLSPSLCKTIAENEDSGIQLIHSFGNSFQKNKYLPKLASGESTACFAHLESETFVTLNPTQVDTTAEMSSDGKHYIVSGKKNWVYNATYADVLIFSAKVNSENICIDEKPVSTLFLIDKNLNGIKVHKQLETLGLKGVDICEVSFDAVNVPTDCVLGNVNEGDELIKKIFTKGKLQNGAQCCSLMRKIINKTINHCISNKFFNKNNYEKDYFKIKVSNIISRLYSVESMTYLVTGRVDSFNEADVFLESLILKIFASESLQYVLQQCLGVLGTEFFSSDLRKMYEDSQFFTTFDYTNDYLRLVLASTGCRHVKKYSEETNILRKLMEKLNYQNYQKYLSLGVEGFTPSKTLKGYLHLTFETESMLLENTVFQLKETVNFLFKKHGDNIFSKALELKLLADLVIDIYTITAVLSRASRSYCLAVRNQELDYSIAQSEVSRIHKQFYKTNNFIKNTSVLNKLQDVGLNVLDTKGYREIVPGVAKF